MDDARDASVSTWGPGPGGAVEDPAAHVVAMVREHGFFVIDDVIGPDAVDRLRSAVDDAVEADAVWIEDRPDEYGRVLSLVRYGGPFLDLLDHDGLMAPFDRALDDDCILYTMTTSCLPPGGRPRPVHVDFDRAAGEEVLYLAAIVMLDEFTVESGATRFLPGSGGTGRPDDRDFDERSVPAEGRAGSVCWFDPRLWHTSGENRSSEWRRSILIGMVRRWMKPRFDHPAMLRSAAHDLSPKVRRVLGFDSRPPGTYEEYYARGAGPRPS